MSRAPRPSVGDRITTLLTGFLLTTAARELLSRSSRRSSSRAPASAGGGCELEAKSATSGASPACGGPRTPAGKTFAPSTKAACHRRSCAAARALRGRFPRGCDHMSWLAAGAWERACDAPSCMPWSTAATRSSSSDLQPRASVVCSPRAESRVAACAAHIVPLAAAPVDYVGYIQPPPRSGNSFHVLVRTV